MYVNYRIHTLSSGVASLLVAAALLLPPAQPARAASHDVIHRIDFTGQPDGDATRWLRQRGFELRLDADELNARFEDGRLVLETESGNAGLFVRELELDEVERIRLTWGVDRYPRGADWSEGVYRVPIAAMTFFGDREIDSGSLFVPDAPYFITLFLGRNEQEGRAYTARYYNKGGRYFCTPCSPPAGATVTTEFNLDEAFQEQFDVSPTPPVTGFGIQMNTRDTGGGARAFLETIEFRG